MEGGGMHESVYVDLWRERGRDVARGVEAARVGRGTNGGFAEFLGRLRRGFAALGYSWPGRARGRGGAGAGARCRRRAVSRAERRRCVDERAAVARFEAAVTSQVGLAGGDPAVEAAARALREALRPAARQLVADLAEQAAAEVDAQLPYQKVEVVLRGGQPTLVVRPDEEAERRPVGEDLEARVTLRLPPSLKGAIEEAARSAGESVNTFLVRDLSRMTAGPGRVGSRMRGTVRT